MFLTSKAEPERLIEVLLPLSQLAIACSLPSLEYIKRYCLCLLRELRNVIVWSQSLSSFHV